MTGMSASAATTARNWFVVVPVKRFDTAKSRLLVPPQLRAGLARAMALDTVTAALRCPLIAAVVVVTDEPSSAFADLGALVIPDSPAAGLNPALRHGAATAPAAAGTAALSADLPALKPAELAGALRSVPAGGRGVVADATGEGTTLLAAAPGVALQPAFGSGSFRRHLASGAQPLPAVALSGLRRDVDTVADLTEAAALGLGRRTRRLYAEVHDGDQ